MQANFLDVSVFNGRRLYTGLRLDYRLWALTSASRAISEVAEFNVGNVFVPMQSGTGGFHTPLPSQVVSIDALPLSSR